ncbi:MAG: Nif3-like dinuclear metal center hexameric protein [Fimbriimonadaceae bacterium]|nr:Nif3-like dinuclear metal center hexameric protein [Fimbriimonadaceae bacterium]
MKLVQEIGDHLAAWLPPCWAESWDNVGLLIGDPAAAVTRVLVAYDLTAASLREATGRQAELLVVFHPPIFRPLSRLTADDPRSTVVWAAARAGLAVYATHTALDAARPGTSDWLATAVGATVDGVLCPAAGAPERGIGRLASLAAQPLGDFARSVGQALGARHLRTVGDLTRPVRRLAVVGGSGASLLEAAAAAGAEVLLTGDLKHHDALLAERLGLAVVDPGHWATERLVVPRTAAELRVRLPAVDVIESALDGEPFGAPASAAERRGETAA